MVRLSRKRFSQQSLIFFFDLAALLTAIFLLDEMIEISVPGVVVHDLDVVAVILLVFFVWLGALLCGFYSLNPRRIGLRVNKTWIVNKMLDAVFFILFLSAMSDGQFSWHTYLLVVVIYSGASVALRIAAERICRNSRFRVPICFLVDHPAVAEIIDEFVLNPQVAYTPAFVLSSNSVGYARAKVRVVRDESEAFMHIKQDHIPIVVISENSKRGDMYGKPTGTNPNRVRYYPLERFYELAMQKVPLAFITRKWLLENVKSDDSRIYAVYKRIFDIVLSSLMLIASLPLWPIICIAIKLESPGPVFFRQERLGKDRRSFTILKFRTMRVNGNNQAPTEEKDSRVTMVGDFIRKTRLDEIPQAVNILKGEMSFVGPRPERPEIAEQLAREIPYYYERNRVLPGITGWDQVCGEYHSPSCFDTYKKLQYDLYYIKNRSMQLDLKVLLKTIPTVLLREGR